MDASSAFPTTATPTAATPSPPPGGTTPVATAATSGSQGHSFLWSGEDFSFGDVLDVINPLQHLPVVSTIYRAITGDRIGHLPQLLGDTLYGGAMGAASAVANIATEEITGKDIGEQVLSVLGLDGSSSPASTQLASAGGGAPAAPVHLVALSRGPMDPQDRRDDPTGGIDNGKIWGVSPVLNATLASASGGIGPAGAAPISGSGLAAPAGAGPLAASMAAADAAVAAGLSGLDTGSPLAGSPTSGSNVAAAPTSGTGGTAAAGAGMVASAGAGTASGMRPLITSSQGGMVRSLSGQTLSNHAVPLSLPNSLSGGFRRSPTAPGANAPQSTSPLSTGLGMTAANDVGVTVSNSAAGTTGAPLDISQRMIDALDRYNQLEAARKAAQGNTVSGVH